MRATQAITAAATAIALCSCTTTQDDLSACRLEAEKVIVPIEFQHRDQLFWPGEQRARIVRPCMEAKGYTLDSDHVNRIASAKGFLIENIVSYEPSVWTNRFGRTDKNKIPDKLQP